MPNWTHNTLRITGEKIDMDHFYDSALKMDINNEMSFSFSNLFPIPEKIKNTISPSSSALGKKWINENLSTKRSEKLSEILNEEVDYIDLIPVENNSPEKCRLLILEYGAENWYDWNVINWGTKWDCEVLLSDSVKDHRLFDCEFDTAWSPPINFLINLQNKFPKLNIQHTFLTEGSDDRGQFITERTGNEVKLIHSGTKYDKFNQFFY
jgi:hypothetical protein